MKIAELEKGVKTVEALAEWVLKDSRSSGSSRELAATLLRLNPHLRQIKHLPAGTPILLPPDLGSAGESAGPSANIADALVQQAKEALHELQTAIRESAAHAGEEARQAQAWLKSERAKQILREAPELKAEFGKTLTAANKMRNEETALLAGQEKLLRKLEADLGVFQKSTRPTRISRLATERPLKQRPG